MIVGIDDCCKKGCHFFCFRFKMNFFAIVDQRNSMRYIFGSKIHTLVFKRLPLDFPIIQQLIYIHIALFQIIFCRFLRRFSGLFQISNFFCWNRAISFLFYFFLFAFGFRSLINCNRIRVVRFLLVGIFRRFPLPRFWQIFDHYFI
eukprot:NODE_33_length_36935_cov_1.609241.p26 type:complete len:146 gc:universal NODE_33_length_36935_cov_1.609241:1996-2433(+)